MSLRDGMRSEPMPCLGSAIAAGFRGLGLDEDIAELRGHPARPAEFD